MTVAPRAAWEAVSFDCYGTLVDWEAGIRAAFVETAALDGVELNPDAVIRAYMDIEPQVESGPFRRYREVLTETAARVADTLGWPIDRKRAGFLPASLPDWPVFPDVPDALRRLKSRFRIAILSNVDDDLLRATIQRIGVDFDWTVTAQQTRSYKPAAGHFQAAVDRVGGPERLLHAAQSRYHDVAPALEHGIAVVWVNRNAEDGPVLPSPAHTVRDLAELADWLAA